MGRGRNAQSTEEEVFSPVIQRKMGKTNKEDRQEKIKVCVRCRPMNKKEKNANAKVITNIVEDTGEINIGLKTYLFDKVFGPRSNQMSVYREVVEPVIKEVLQGYSCTIFAYGQTGTGKTFTMEGERSDGKEYSWENDPKSGIIPRTMNHIFDCLNESGNEFTVQVSLIEIYNEEIMDLLSTTHTVEKLKMYDDTKGGVKIKGVSEISVKNKDGIYAIMERGSIKRKVAATEMNAHSSRSHCVFQIQVNMKINQEDRSGIGEEYIRQGRLYLVDLAGSENVGRSGAQNQRAREAGNINQSLLSLGRVITGLVEGSPHIPYRESKLTRLLQDSLGGSTKTSIIATISPSSCSQEETLSTLDYARRAKNIKNKPTVNQAISKRALIKQYVEQIDQLNAELAASREQFGVYLDPAQYERMKQDLEDLIHEKEQRLVTDAKVDKELEDLRIRLEEKSAEYDQQESELKETRDELYATQFVKRERYEGSLRSWQQGKRLQQRIKQSEDELNTLHIVGETLKHKQDRNIGKIDVLKNDHSQSTNNIYSFVKEKQQLINSTITESQVSTKKVLQEVNMVEEGCNEYVAKTNELNSGAKEKMTNFVCRLETVVLGMEDEKLKTILDLASSIRATIDGFAESQKIMAAKLNDTVHEQSTRNRDTLSSLKENISIIKKDVGKLRYGVADKLQSINEAVNEGNKSNSGTMEHIMNLMHNHLETTRNTHNRISTELISAGKTINGDMTNIHTFCDIPTKEINDGQTLFEEQTKSLLRTTEDLNSNSISLKSNLSKQLDTLVQDSSSFNETVKTKVSHSCSTVQDMTSANVAESAQHSDDFLRRNKQLISTCIDSTKQIQEKAHSFLHQCLKDNKDIKADISSLTDVVQTCDLSVYEPSGETPLKRERFDSSIILSVESDKDILERFVPPEEPVDEPAVEPAPEQCNLNSSSTSEEIEDEHPPKRVSLRDFNTRESISHPIFQQKYGRKRPRVGTDGHDQENVLPRPNI